MNYEELSKDLFWGRRKRFEAFAKRVEQEFGIDLASPEGLQVSVTKAGVRPADWSHRSILDYFRFRKWRQMVLPQISDAIITVPHRYGRIIKWNARGKLIFKSAHARANKIADEFGGRWKAIRAQADAEGACFDPVNTRKAAQRITIDLDAERRIITVQNDEGEFTQQPEKLPEPLEIVVTFLKENIDVLAPEQTLRQFHGILGSIDNAMFRALPRTLHAAFYDELYDWDNFVEKNQKYADYFHEFIDEQLLDQINAVQQFVPRLAEEEPISPQEFYMKAVDENPGLGLAPGMATARLERFGYILQRIQQQLEEPEDFDEYEFEDFQTHPAKRALNLLAEVKAAVKFDVRENLKASHELRAVIQDTDKDFNEVMSALFETPTARRIWRVRRHELYGVSFVPDPTQPTDTLCDVFDDANSPKAMREVRELVGPRIFQALVASHICDAATAATSRDLFTITLDISKFERTLGIDDQKSEKFEATREALRLAHKEPDSKKAVEAIKDLQDLVDACRLAFHFMGRDDVVEFAPD